MRGKRADDDSIPLGLWPDANRLGVDLVEYDELVRRYEKMAHIQLRDSGTVVVSGYGVHLKVEYDSLVVEYERGHIPGRKKLLRLDRGVHKMRQIFICSWGGYVSFEALDWCSQQEITVFLLNWKNDVVHVITPRQYRSARLVYLQYQASESELGVEIAREVIRRKTLQQITAIVHFPDHTIEQGRVLFRKGKRAVLKFNTIEFSDPIDYFREGLELLKVCGDRDSIRMLEAKLAHTYWGLLIGTPIFWDRAAEGKIPEHWYKIPERVSGVSSSNNASQATNPFHAVLNFAYAVLKAQVLQSILVHGLDETIGFLHYTREGNQALVYDLMEPFRSLVDISALSIFDKTIFTKSDFIQTTTGECQLNEGMRHHIVDKCRVPNRDIDQLVERVVGMIGQ